MLWSWYPSLYVHHAQRSLVRRCKEIGSLIGWYQDWMSANVPKLNEKKTELFICSPKHQVRIKMNYVSARLVTCTHKRERITLVLNSLHWLPVIYRSQYKILVYTFKALQGNAPQYLEELVIPYQPTRSLWSEYGAFLAVPTRRGVTYGNRCLERLLQPYGIIF